MINPILRERTMTTSTWTSQKDCSIETNNENISEEQNVNNHSQSENKFHQHDGRNGNQSPIATQLFLPNNTPNIQSGQQGIDEIPAVQNKPFTMSSSSSSSSSSPMMTTNGMTTNGVHKEASGKDLFEVSELRSQLKQSQISDRLANHVWASCGNLWLQPHYSAESIPEEIQSATKDIVEVLNQENDRVTLTKRAQYGLETKNRLVNRLHEEVDLFMMSPECTPALRYLDTFKEQLSFHYHRITQHVINFADLRFRTIPIGNCDVKQSLCISTWAQCVGYELLCELLDSLIKEVETLRKDCIQSCQVVSSLSDENVSNTLPAWEMDKTCSPGYQRLIPTVSADSPRDVIPSGASLQEIKAFHNEMRLKRGGSCSFGGDDEERSRSGSCGSQHEMDSLDGEQGNKKKSRYGSALPQSARSFLDTWLSSHWHDPYPTPDEKAELAHHCRITVDQVNHWFINARVRRWRPTMEKAASRAKTSGSNNAFAALVKDCGDSNPFAKFLGPITMNQPSVGNEHHINHVMSGHQSTNNASINRNKHRFERRV